MFARRVLTYVHEQCAGVARLACLSAGVGVAGASTFWIGMHVLIALQGAFPLPEPRERARTRT